MRLDKSEPSRECSASYHAGGILEVVGIVPHVQVAVIAVIAQIWLGSAVWPPLEAEK
jgi:hypothetical protein